MKCTTIVPRKLTFCEIYSTCRNNCPFVGAQVSTYSRMLGLPIPSHLGWAGLLFHPNSRSGSRRLEPTNSSFLLARSSLSRLLGCGRTPPSSKPNGPRSHWPMPGNDVRSFFNRAFQRLSLGLFGGPGTESAGMGFTKARLLGLAIYLFIKKRQP